MKKMVFALAAAAVLAASAAEVIAVKTLTGNEELFVAEGETLRIEYLKGGDKGTLTKTGPGTLEIAVVDDRTRLVVAEGILKGVRPGKLQTNGIPGAFFHVDASDTAGMTIEENNGIKSLTRWGDVDGRETYATNRVGRTKPFIVDGALNGLPVMDFGNMYFDSVTFPAATGASCMEFSSVKIQRDSFWIWKDVDGVENMAHSSDFFGATPVCMESALYRGTGGNGKHFYLSHVGPPDRFRVKAYIDGNEIKGVSSTRVGPGWHLMSYRLPEGEFEESWHKIYGASAFGRRSSNLSPFGGFKLAEAIFFTEKLSDENYQLVYDHLNAKWFGSQVRSVIVKSGAKLDLTATIWRIGALGRFAGSVVEGSGNVRAGSVFNPDNSAEPAGAMLSYGSDCNMAAANLAFEGDGEISVAAGGSVRGNIVSVNGTLKKTGDGKFSFSHLSGETDSIEVAAGELIYSPLASSASAIHLDATQGVETEALNGTNFVTRWVDVNGDIVNAALPIVGEGYKFATGTNIRKPYVTENGANNLPLVDFGTLADKVHTAGWGAALGFTNPFGGEKSPYVSYNGWLSAFIVWEDRNDAIDTPLVDGKEFRGPCLFGQNYIWFRGNGGGGNGFSLKGEAASFRNDVIFDGVGIKPIEVGTNRVSRGLHMMANKAGTQDGLLGASRIGCYVNTIENSTYGGMRFGECIFFRNHIPEQQRINIISALGVKWFGSDKYSLEHGFSRVSVAKGAGLSCPYGDVTIGELALSGKISARSVSPSKLAAAGGEIDSRLVFPDMAELTISALPDGDNGAFSAVAAIFSGRGSVKLAFADAEAAAIRGFKLFATGNGPETPERIRGWKVFDANATRIGSLCLKADGCYVTGDVGFTMIVK